MVNIIKETIATDLMIEMKVGSKQMKIIVSKELQKIYTVNHKNWNYSLGLLLGSLDLDSCEMCMSIVDRFELSGGRVEIKIDDPLIEKVETFFGSKNDENLIEKLLWIAAFLPEV